MNTEDQIQGMLAPEKRNPRQMDGGYDQYLENTPRIVCADGFTLSVQAGFSHYCAPRDGIGPWHKVEVGFPSQAEPALAEWAEEPENLMGTVYGYVPLSVVASVIDDHGGIVI